MKKIHYWTDSPSSQYKNRFMVRTILSHEDKYGIKAQWNYFEAGHGKGRCDGLGGTTKRMADEAICQGKAIIQDAREFYRYAITSSMREVTFIFIEKETCMAKKEELDGLCIKTVKKKYHEIVCNSRRLQNNSSYTSCYCELCLRSDYCDGWSRTSFEVRNKEVEATSVEVEAIIHESTGNARTEEVDTAVDEENSRCLDNTDTYVTSSVGASSDIFYHAGEFVACVYEGKWYVGEVQSVDIDDQDIEIKFMEKTKEQYRWPRNEDKFGCLSPTFSV